MNHRQQMQQFSKLLAYILERHPDEFGLVPDEEGFVGLKDLLKALGETEGWRHIRRTHFNELMLAEPDPPFEIRDNRIRGKSRGRLPKAEFCEHPPKTLYTAIRKRAYPSALEKGVQASAESMIICTGDRETAERLGKRKDNHPVVLTVHTAKAAGRGVSFTRLGSLYLAETLPPETFSGPPLPKMPEQTGEPRKKEPDVKEYQRKTTGGSYTVRAEDLDPARSAPGQKKGKGKKKDPAWKQEQRKKRRR